LIPCAVEKILEHGRNIINGDINPLQLVCKTRISKDATDYKVNNCAKSALLQLRDLGVSVSPGQSIHYVITHEHSRNYKERVCILESLTNDTPVDVDYYLRQIAKCAESVLIPFGFTLEDFEEIFQKMKYHEKDAYAPILSRTRIAQAHI
jgi:DNA polymerase elongation subunit (family B)